MTTACWTLEPKNRPSFSQIVSWMTGKIQSLDDIVEDMSSSPSRPATVIDTVRNEDQTVYG